MVWPTVFDAPDVEHLKLDDEGLGSAGLPSPPWTGYAQDLWEDLPRLEEALRAGWGSHPRHCRIIAVSVVGEWRARVPPVTPPAVSEGWSLLGFDVSDGFLLSGLANCGYQDNEIGALRDRWVPRLNTHHLFESVVDADEFRQVSNERVKEHAPFFVYGLRLVTTMGHAK
ncbi:MAG TPA: hypothetical protein VFM39_05540 [bacterium]|nr:hypothetical protein [bacterium]